MTVHLPNFLITGAAKAGTSSLYHYLKQHPDIYMSPIKEPHHWSYKHTQPVANGPGDIIGGAITDFAEYTQLFAGVTTEKAIGEASPTYILVPGTAARIHAHNPDMKLITILRNPVDRAFSAFMHLVRDGREKQTDFRKSLALQAERATKQWGPLWQYEQGSLYANSILEYQALFPADQLHFIVYDDFKLDPMAVLQNCFTFLSINPTFEPDISFRINVSGNKKSPFLDSVYTAIFDHPNPIRYISRQLIPEKIRYKFTSNLRNQNLQSSKVDSELRHILTERFREDILQTQDLIQRDLSHWLNSNG